MPFITCFSVDTEFFYYFTDSEIINCNLNSSRTLFACNEKNVYCKYRNINTSL
jgi:hypothetical protein